MSTSSVVPAWLAPGSISRPGLIVPNVTVTSAWIALPRDLAGVGVDSARQVDCHHHGAVGAGILRSATARAAAGSRRPP